MCQGNCSGCNECAPQGVPGQPGRPGDPGATPTITMSAVSIPFGDDPTVIQSGTLLNPHFEVGIPQGEQGDPGDPGADGDDGDDGNPAWTLTTSTFTQPDPGDSVVVNVEYTGFLSIGLVVFVTYGGYYQVTSNPGATTVSLMNLGYTPPSGSYVAPGDPVPPLTPSIIPIVTAAGPRGVQGLPGTGSNGLTPVIDVVYSIPVSPPVSAARNLVLYANQAPPTPATTFVPYTWNGASWVAGPNIAGAPGAQTFFGPADPNLVAVPGSNVGDAFWRIAGGSATAFKKTSISTWVSQGTISTAGSVTQNISHVIPGPETLDLAYFSFNVDLKDDIELDWSDANFNGQGEWIVTMKNTSGGAVDLTFATGQWEEDAALALSPPISIPNTEVRVVRFVLNSSSGLRTITSLYEPSAL